MKFFFLVLQPYNFLLGVVADDLALFNPHGAAVSRAQRVTEEHLEHVAWILADVLAEGIAKLVHHLSC